MELGYDGFTHTGGKRTGYPEHRVFILFDPNNMINTKDESYNAISSLEKLAISQKSKQNRVDRKGNEIKHIRKQGQKFNSVMR